MRKSYINVLKDELIPKAIDSEGEQHFLLDCVDCIVEEERNGLFELSLSYPIDSETFKYLKKESIIRSKANDTLLNQDFRIYLIKKPIKGIITLFARHISFDLAYDYVDNVTFKNQSCEYALNQLFRQSQFSKHYRGYSDIVNAQDYSMSMCNVLEAIAGKKGSIIDTYGNGAEILRDNTNIHVLNRRGNDRGVTIEYKKNLTGFDLEEDTTDLITRIIPYAKYNQENEEVIVKAPAVDSKYINNYSHPYIRHIDYSDKFQNGEIPTPEKLTKFAQEDFKTNRKDIIKQNFKIQFIPLSRCVGYEGLEDRISLCDTVTVINTIYNIETQVKVIKYTYDVLTGRYKSIELGEPKTTLGDIITGSGNNTVTEEEVRDIVNNAPSTNYPNTLPNVPVVTLRAGLGVIAIDWTFETKAYYTYEVYASRTKDFTPNSFDLIFKGQSSSFSHYTEPNQTWYYKVRAINTHNNSTGFSEQKFATTGVIDPDTQWVAKGAIGDAQIGTLSLDRGWVDQLKGQWIDARQLTVTDGNGKRTLDIDSFGNIYGDFTSLKFNSKDIIEVASNVDFVNLVPNSTAQHGLTGWEGNVILLPTKNEEVVKVSKIHFLNLSKEGYCIVIQDVSGMNILIDSGEEGCYSTTHNYIRNVLGITRFNYVFATHSHSDHIGDMDAFLRDYTVDELIYRSPNWDKMPDIEFTPAFSTDKHHSNMIAMANSRGVKQTQANSDIIRLSSESYIRLINIDYDDYTNYNNISFGVLYVHNDLRFLLMSDISQPAQMHISNTIGKVNMMTAPHHGYFDDTNIDFLNETKPDLTIFQNTGMGGKEGTLDKFKAINSICYATCLDGNIVIESDGKKYKWTSVNRL